MLLLARRVGVWSVGLAVYYVPFSAIPYPLW